MAAVARRFEPDVSLRVMGDGSLRPFMPNAIQFRDGDLLRPVAPFFELWATVEEDDGRCKTKQVTTRLLEKFKVELDSVKYTITVANRKAHRRTLSAACAYIARESAIRRRSPAQGAPGHQPAQCRRATARDAGPPHTSGVFSGHEADRSQKHGYRPYRVAGAFHPGDGPSIWAAEGDCGTGVAPAAGAGARPRRRSVGGCTISSPSKTVSSTTVPNGPNT